MNLVVDIGNTSAKLWLYDGALRVAHVRAKDLQEGLEGILPHGTPSRGVVATVGVPFDDIATQLEKLRIPLLNVTGNTPTPLQMRYRSVSTLGADRLAAAVGAWSLMQGCDWFVVDAGTCITCDFVSKDAVYCGGNITLGIDKRLQALHHYTERLPLVNKTGDTPFLGYDTETALRSGVLQGIRCELQGYAAELKKAHPKLRIAVTGGDARLICKTLRPDIIDEDLIARGLNSILSHNEIH